jgi:hypothetical protein
VVLHTTRLLALSVSPRRHLVVDGPSLAALDIFKDEEHPSAMGIGSSKEGVSLYGLLQRCVTGMVRRGRGACAEQTGARPNTWPSSALHPGHVRAAGVLLRANNTFRAGGCCASGSCDLWCSWM